MRSYNNRGIDHKIVNEVLQCALKIQKIYYLHVCQQQLVGGHFEAVTCNGGQNITVPFLASSIFSNRG